MYGKMSLVRCAVAMLFLGLTSASEVISDLVAPEADQQRALRLREESFWAALAEVAEDMRLLRHAQLYEEVEQALPNLAADHPVAQALSESLQRLKRADAAVLAQGLRSSQLISDALATPGELPGGLSWLANGPSWLGKALASLVEGREYQDRLGEEVQQRQQALLPALQSAASVTADVLKETRLSSSRAFDALKYDIYTPGAASETRRCFTQFISSMAKSLADDVQSRSVPAATSLASADLPAVESATPTGNIIFPA
ncbi:hypothetical protein AK812_SmicGene14306 [Symbiodinium microadriaticum]|uniref:Uncharacterized protein n=1 Tax=Symbiodinium microadriaticum TaxID=2951 RepID=A0A1Q9E5W9_SYMMI|nr:hypothetical protein AK812_SmicGene14306 [Symbiodinium microadriaticum]